jgi:RNA ligase (TIGR02306 family)
MVAELQEFDEVETRKLASFRTVDDIQPIDGADAIELAVVGGWKVVTRKGEFKPGDPCVYFEIDSFLPDGVSAWQFLVDKQSRIQNGVTGHRLRTIKLRGQFSQGLILPLDALPITRLVLKPELTPEDVELLRVSDPELQAEVKNIRYGLHEHEAGLSPEDMNLNKLLGIVKWDPPLPTQLQGMAEGLFPSWIRKTDQERAQNLSAEIFGYDNGEVEIDCDPSAIAQSVIDSGRIVIRAGKAFSVRPAKGDRNARYEITMKLDGSSATFGHRDGEEIVCSRNLQLKICDGNKDNSFVRMYFDSLFNCFLPTFGNIAVQGELMGPSIQGNREQLKDTRFYVFDVQLLDEGRYMTPAERKVFMDKLYNMGVNPMKVQHVLIIGYDVNLEELGLTTMDKLLKFAERPSIVHAVSEGDVYKKMDGTFSFKVINNVYLAKEKD